MISIRELADRFDVPISTLHYWERRGLLSAQRRSGQRCYAESQVYRAALIQHWRDIGRLSIADIAELLSTPAGKWRQTVVARRASIAAQIEVLESARNYLDELLGCEHRGTLDECPGFRARVGGQRRK